MTLFAEYPPKEPRRQRPYKPTGFQRAVLDILREHGPMGERDIFERYIVDRQLPEGVWLSKVVDAVDKLAKHGLVADTGERGRWTRGGREIIWQAGRRDQESA